MSRRTTESKIKESCWLGTEWGKLSMCQLLPDAYVLSPIAYFFPELLKVEDFFEFLSSRSAFPRLKERSAKLEVIPGSRHIKFERVSGHIVSENVKQVKNSCHSFED